jgi:tRNA (guanosine-2'-O-)-methyltransferase
LQQATSKLKQSSVNWPLSKEEQLEKRLDWCEKTIKSSAQVIERFYSAQ